MSAREAPPRLLGDPPDESSEEDDDDGEESQERSPLASKVWLVGSSLAVILTVVLVVNRSAFFGGATAPSKQGSAAPGPPFEVLTAETRRNVTSFVMPGAPGMYFTNIGIGQKWGGLISKMRMYLDYATKRAATTPDALLIFVDGGDVAYGGCTEEELLSRYRRVVEASSEGANGAGPQVVAGGDFKLWPVYEDGAPFQPANAILNGNEYGYFTGRHDRVLAAFNGTRLQYSPYHTSAKGVKAPDYNFLNSGFIMGPAWAVTEILTCMSGVTWDKEYYAKSGRVWHDRYYDDQLAMTECMFNHRNNVTIDYSGLLALTMNGVTTDVFVRRGNVLVNRPYNQTQCFIHFNGEPVKVERAALEKWGFGPFDDAYWNPTQNTTCPHGFCHKR